LPPRPCTSSSECGSYSYCDTGANICKAKNRYTYQGATGCELAPRARYSSLASLLAALMVLLRRVRRNKSTPVNAEPERRPR